ncbi:MAG: nuclear transport factor 2 family protein [Colwellia sp.]|nr:nuclear transport factor 2 family protein [Colwellia sp.]
MRILKLFLPFVLLTVSATSFGKESPFTPVQDLFSAMSEVDHQKMKGLVTTDFQLLEVGEDWSIDDLIKVIKPSKSKRRNYFNVIKTKISGQMAWVSYWNKATFTNGDNINSVAWLESAVMIKDGSSWKIQMLHSTRIKPESIPKNIELTEYVD